MKTMGDSSNPHFPDAYYACDLCFVPPVADVFPEAVILTQTDIGIVVSPDGIGPGRATGHVRRIAFDASGNPKPPETMDQGLAQMLMGADPMKVEEIWERLYTGSAMTGRRGAVVHAIDTSGRAVLFAGGTVVISLLGQIGRAHV
mgnify:CR=1 FL=1